MSRSVLWLRVLSRTNLAHCSHTSSRNPRLFNLLQPLASPFATPGLCFQQLAASFPKTPGWGVHSLCGNPCLPSLPRASGTSQGSHLARVSKYAEPTTVTTFKVNTCKSVSKQRTLTLSRINTYKKRGEGGTPIPFQLPARKDWLKGNAISCGLRGSRKLAGANTHAALWTSPEAKVGMLGLHFEQVHRMAITGTVLTGKNLGLVDGEVVLRVQEIAIRSAVMDETIRFLAGVSYAI